MLSFIWVKYYIYKHNKNLHFNSNYLHFDFGRFWTEVTKRTSRFLGDYKRQFDAVWSVWNLKVSSRCVWSRFFDKRNILLSMFPSITGNDFKGAISNVSDTRGHWELIIAFIKKAAPYASGGYFKLSNASNQTILTFMVSEKTWRPFRQFWRINVVILDTK